MAEVGILNLEIRDNSAEAENNLSKLSDALRAVKSACCGTELNSVANALEKINSNINTQTPGVLKSIGSALEKIKAASNFELPNLQGLKSVMKYMETMQKNSSGLANVQKQAMESAVDTAKNVAQGFENVETGISNATERYKEFIEVSEEAEKTAKTANPMEKALEIARSFAEDYIDDKDIITTAHSVENVTKTVENFDDKLEQVKNASVEATKETVEQWEKVTEQIDKASDELDDFCEKVQKQRELDQAGGYEKQLYDDFGNPTFTVWVADPESEFYLNHGTNPAWERYQNILKGKPNLPHEDQFSRYAVQGWEAEQGSYTENTEKTVENLENVIEQTEKTIDTLDNGLEHIKNASAEAAAESTREWQEATSELQTIMQERAAIMAAEDQKRLEANYQSYRELFMSGEGNWQQIAQEAYGFTAKAFEEGKTYGEALKITMEEINSYVDHFIESMNTPTGPLFRDIIDSALGIGNAFKSAKESASVLKNAPEISEHFEQVKTQAQNTTDSFQKAGSATVVLGEDLRDLDKELKQKKIDIDNVSDSSKTLIDYFRDLMSIIHKLGDAIKKMFPGLTGLMKRFSSLIKYRVLRTVLKHISEGFQEGVENVYHYSKAIGSSFYKSMDNASAALLQMKNSIGAAVAPAIQALIPLLQSVVNWFIQGVNWINQFFALLSGQKTWTRAVLATTSAYDDQTKAAKKAGAAVKDLLADWDELNIIQSNSAGGGAGAGTSAAEDYLKMFEEVSVFDRKVKDVVKFLQENMKEIYTIAIAIGASILAWKISNALSSLIPSLAGLVGTAIPIVLTVTANAVLDNKFLETGDAGYLVKGFVATLLGSFITGKISEALLGEGAATYTIPLTLIASAVTDVVANLGETDVSALDIESIGLSAKSAVESGIAAGYLAYKIGGATGAVATGVGGLTAVAWFAAAIGIKAFTDEMHTDMTGVNQTTIKNAMISAVGIGTSIAAIGMMFGLPMLVGVGGIGGAIVTFAAIVGIKAYLSAQAAEWGDVSLTEKQVTAFVKNQMLNIDADVAINKIHATVENLDADKTDIETKLTDVLGTFKVIQMGIADNQDYEQLKTDVDSLVETVQSYADDAKKAGKLVLQFVPKLVGENEGDQSEWYKNYTSGWDTVNEYIKGKGAEIGSLFVEGANGEIILKEPETLQTLMQYMNDVTEAMTKAKINSEAEMEFRIGLSDLTEKSYGEVVNKFADYKTKLKAEYQSLVDSMYINQSQLTAALYQIYVQTGTAEAEAEWKAAQEQLDKMKENLGTAADDMVKEASMGGAEALITFLREKYQTAITALNKDFESGLGYLEFFSDGGKTAEEMNQHIIEMLRPNNATLAKSLADTGLSGWNVLTDEIKAQVREAMIAGFGIDVTDEIIRMWESELPETMREADQVLENNEPAPQIKANKFYQGLDGMIEKTKNTVQTIMDMLSNLNTNVTVSTDVRVGGGGRWWGSSDEVQMRANGGPIRSGDLIMANENGQIEMMGKMGRDPVVANNQQIVDGITSGVTNANDNVVSELRNLLAVTQRILNKKFSAQVVAGSGLGRANQMSADAYGRVTG